MSFIVRCAVEEDLEALFALAEQFTLLNLPANREILTEKIQKSIASFKGDIKELSESEYIFVLEDTSVNKIVASSMVLGKHGTPQSPHYSFKILKQEMSSEELGVGFIHHVLRLFVNEDGPTEIGGLLVDREYRGHPEKLGKFISLIRFMYMGMHPERFQNNLLCEFAPKLLPDGRSEFWESLGRKFTGLKYKEADSLSLKSKGFIRQLFPISDIYLALLPPSVRVNLGKVSLETEPAKHMLESIGFSYQFEVDPFDGGPHFGCELKDVSLVKNLKKYSVKESSKEFTDYLFVAKSEEDSFHAVQCLGEIQGSNVFLEASTISRLEISSGENLYVTYA
ncbi:MAG: arginine N-succinyltransferase [Bdellovibrionales bacterium]